MGKRVSVIALLLMLVACGGGSNETELLAPQREALERAEDVERILQEGAERQHRLIEEQGG